MARPREKVVSEYKPPPHPVLPWPSDEEIEKLCATPEGRAEFIDWAEKRALFIHNEEADPYRYGYYPQHWTHADDCLDDGSELFISGGNRSGKSEYAARRTMSTLLNERGMRVLCLNTSNQTSIALQQAVVYKYLPIEFKDAKKTRVTNVSYSQKNGFSDNTFVLPNTSQCWFLNYMQDRDVIEGQECDLVWCDELVPLDWLETLRYRLITRRGKLIVTFTPIDGYSASYRDFVSGCSITKVLPADLLDKELVHVPGCPPGTMPYQATTRNNNRVMWFHTRLNPYNPYDQLQKQLKGRTSSEIKIRAYGWAERMSDSMFPRFSSVNVLPDDRIPTEGTNYMAIDPAGARNWFMVWLRVDELGRRYVYREWPGYKRFGEWALPGDKPDGRPGPAQKLDAGRGIDDYVKLIRNLEGKEKIYDRYIDPRAGATQAAGKDGGTSIIDLLADAKTPLLCVPSAGIRVDQGVATINDWLAYDQNEPISTINEPGLYVAESCRNLIYCMKEWTGLDGEKGATKDPIDALRYIAVMDPEYVDPKRELVVGGGAY